MNHAITLQDLKHTLRNVTARQRCADWPRYRMATYAVTPGTPRVSRTCDGRLTAPVRGIAFMRSGGLDYLV